MIAEISAGFSSLNAAKQIIQGLNALNTEIAVNDAKIKLQSLILEAQQGLFAAQQAEAANAEKVALLEKEIMRLKDWSAEKERYELKKYNPGSFAYTPKRGMENGQPSHRLCSHCYEQGKKSILQGTADVSHRYRLHECPSCHFKIPIGEEMRA